MSDLLRRLCCADRRQNEPQPPGGITYVNEAFQIEVQNQVHPPSFDDDDDDIKKSPITDEKDVVLESCPADEQSETCPDSGTEDNEGTDPSQNAESVQGNDDLQEDESTDQVEPQSDSGISNTTEGFIPEEAPPDDNGPPEGVSAVVEEASAKDSETEDKIPVPELDECKDNKKTKYNDDNCEKCEVGGCDGSPDHNPRVVCIVTCAEECGVPLPDTEDRVDTDNNIVGCDDCYVNDNVCTCDNESDSCDADRLLLGSFLPFAHDNISIGYDGETNKAFDDEDHSDPVDTSVSADPSNENVIDKNSECVTEKCIDSEHEPSLTINNAKPRCSICDIQCEECTVCPGCSSSPVELSADDNVTNDLEELEPENPEEGVCTEHSEASNIDQPQSNILSESNESLECQSICQNNDEESTTEDNCSSSEIICEAVIEPIPKTDIVAGIEDDNNPATEMDSSVPNESDSTDLIQHDENSQNVEITSQSCPDLPDDCLNSEATNKTEPDVQDKESQDVNEDGENGADDTNAVATETPEPIITEAKDGLSDSDSPCGKLERSDGVVPDEVEQCPAVTQDSCKSCHPPGGSQHTSYTLSGPDPSGPNPTDPDSTDSDSASSDPTHSSHAQPLTNTGDNQNDTSINTYPSETDTREKSLQNLAEPSPCVDLSVRIQRLIDSYMEGDDSFTDNSESIINDICNGHQDAKVIELILFLIEIGYRKGVKRLLDDKIFEYYFGFNWGDPISIAVHHNRADIVELMASSVDWKNLYKNGLSPLHLAVHLAKVDCVTVLLKYAKAARCIDEINSSIDSGEVAKQTAVQIASSTGHCYLVILLLGQGVDVNLVTEAGQTAIWLAAAAGHEDVARLLLQAGTELDLKYSNGQTLLHFYTEQRNHLMVNELLMNGAVVDTTDDNNQTALHKATKGGDYMIAESLVKYGACVMTKDSHGKSPLVLSIEECNATIVELLLSQMAPNEVIDDDGNTPLLLAIQYGHRPTIECIIERNGCDVNHTNYYGKSALHICGQHGLADVAAKILSCPMVDLDILDISGWSALHTAATCGHLTLVAQLVQAGFDGTMQDCDGVSPIVACGLRRIVDVLQYLIATSRHSLPLYHLVTMASVADVMFLKSHGVDFDKQDINGRVPIWHAANQADLSATEALLKVQARVNLPDNCGNTPLHVASQKGLMDIAERLLENDALMTVPNLNKDTPLAIAMENKHERIVKVLLKHGASADSKLRDGRTCIFTAIENNDITMVKILLEYNAHVNHTCSGTMERPIHLAAKLGHVEIVKTLVEFGAEVNAMEFLSRKTPLHLACQYGHHDTVLQLLLSRADISMETILGEKPLLLAAREGRYAVVDSLLKAGAEVCACA